MGAYFVVFSHKAAAASAKSKRESYSTEENIGLRADLAERLLDFFRSERATLFVVVVHSVALLFVISLLLFLLSLAFFG